VLEKQPGPFADNNGHEAWHITLLVDLREKIGEEFRGR
jgi:hypothetical protein